MDFKIVQLIDTPETRALALQDLRVIEDQLYKVHHGLEETEGKLSFTLGKRLLSSITGETDKQAAINELRAQIEKMEAVEVVIGFQATNAQVNQLAKCVKRLWGSEAFMQLKIDLGIKGGIKVARLGKYVDLSLGKKLEDYWQAKRTDWLNRFGIV